MIDDYVGFEVVHADASVAIFHWFGEDPLGFDDYFSVSVEERSLVVPTFVSGVDSGGE